ncbi:MAG: hypothetical protein PF574_06015 [Candidatus Delongbacteria bacterium]|jgi:hypothetical protein|nr:hypothetical protein [Candidatus Delongbacteria bacterium]
MKNLKLSKIHFMLMNYLSLVFIVITFQYMKDLDWTWMFISSEVFFITLFIISFYFSYIKTGTWSFVHRSLEKLDERELKIVGKTSKLAYAIFTIIALAIMLVLSVTAWSINIIFTVALIYFAHILPASILVITNWKEYEEENK